MGKYITMSPGIALDDTTGAVSDAYQKTPGGSGYISTTGTNGLHVTAATTASGLRFASGVRFLGFVPAGTIYIPQAKITGHSVSSSAASVPMHVYGVIPAGATPTSPSPTQQAVMAAGALPFRTGTTAGTNDVVSRTKTAHSVAFTSPAVGGGLNYSIDLGLDIWKDLMLCAGAVFADGTHPYIATTPTQVDIVNPMFIFEGDIVAGSAVTWNMYSYEQYTAAAAGIAGLKILASLPALKLSQVKAGSFVGGLDAREHIAILMDSYSYPFAPGATVPVVKYTYINTLSGTIDTTGLYEFKDGSTDRSPGGINIAWVAVTDKTGNNYYLNDPTGSIYNQGPITPEGRSGFTDEGILWDRFVSPLGVDGDLIAIHHFGLGGTAVAPGGTPTGIWSYASDHGETVVSLDDISDVSEITNFLYKFKDSFDGHTFPELVRDANIQHLTVMLPTEGNHIFAKGQLGACLPIDRTDVAGNAAMCSDAQDEITAGYLTLISDWQGEWDKITRPPGARIEFHLMGLPNLLTDDPRVPAVDVNVGAPPGSGTFHRGAFSTTLDTWYSDGGKMAPFGPSPSTPAAPGGPCPRVPHIIQYLYGGVSIPILGPIVPVPATNITGGLPVPWTGPRAATKDDFGIFHQLKLPFFQSTLDKDFNSLHVAWYAHAAADVFGGSFSTTRFPSESAPNAAQKNQWKNAYDAFSQSYGNYPYSAAGALTGGVALPWNNLPLTIKYVGRNYTNDTVNEALHLIQPAAESAVETLQAEGVECQYVEMWDSLGAEVGTGAYASADRWAFVDGVHLTQPASRRFVDAYITRARANGSPAYLTLLPAEMSVTSRLDKLDPITGDVLETSPTSWATGDHWRTRDTIRAFGPLEDLTATASTMTATIDPTSPSARGRAYDMVTLEDLVAERNVSQGDALGPFDVTDGRIIRVEFAGVVHG